MGPAAIPCRGTLMSLGGQIVQPVVNPACDALWDAVVGPLLQQTAPNPDHARLELDQLAYGFPIQLPLVSQLPHTKMLLKSSIS